MSRQFSNHSEIILKITSFHAVIISSWPQGTWGLGIKPERYTGSASPMAQANVAISEGLSALTAWEHESTDDDRMLMMMMMGVYVPKLAGQ